MSGQSVQGLLPVESFGLLGVSECGVARWKKILAPKEVKYFMVPPPYDSCRAARFSGTELSLKGNLKIVDNLILGDFLRITFWVINYFRWIRVRMGSSMNLSRSHYAVLFRPK